MNEHGHATGVLEAAPPSFRPDEVAAVAARLFGVEGEARDLGSERDQTFLVAGPRSAGVIKLSNLGERAEVLDLETEALLHIARADPELPVAMPRRAAGAADGLAAYRPQVEGPHGLHYARMFERLEGRSAHGAELDDEALAAYGATAARVAAALAGFFHPAAGRVLLWDTARAAELRPLTPDIGPAGRRALVERVLDRFAERVVPALPRLRAQVVHGDLALDNLLVDERGRVTGVVDFGDIMHTALVADLVAALASALRGRAGEDAFRAGRVFLDGYQSRTPLADEELALVGDLLGARLAAIVTISAWRVRRYPENAEYIQAWDADSWALLELLDEAGPEEAAVLLGAPRPPDDSAALARRRRQALWSALAPLTYARPVHLVRGEGVWLHEADGRRLLDGYNNVPVVGHCHPRVTEAVVRQTRRLNTHARYLYEPLVELAERLVATMPPGTGLDTVMVVNSGSEANDLAWRIAEAATGQTAALVTEHAYHGVTVATAALSPEEWPAGARPATVEPFDVGWAHDGDAAAAGAAAEAALARLAERGHAPAALYLDGGFTSDGILTPGGAAVRALVERVQAAGGLLVADEVQASHGRSGEGLWSFESYGLEPDLVTLGKPMGNGYPVAAVVARAALVERLAERTSVFSTFGGNPVAAAAALAVLDVVDDERLIARSARVGAQLRAALRTLAARREEIVEVRGRGLLCGVELADAASAARVVDGLRERGVLVGRTGRAGDVLKIRPPLVFSEEHAELLAARLDETLAAAGA